MNDTTILDMLPERIIQICIQQDDGMYGLSNRGNLYFLRFGKWEKVTAELPK